MIKPFPKGRVQSEQSSPLYCGVARGAGTRLKVEQLPVRAERVTGGGGECQMKRCRRRVSQAASAQLNLRAPRKPCNCALFYISARAKTTKKKTELTQSNKSQVCREVG